MEQVQQNRRSREADAREVVFKRPEAWRPRRRCPLLIIVPAGNIVGFVPQRWVRLTRRTSPPSSERDMSPAKQRTIPR